MTFNELLKQITPLPWRVSAVEGGWDGVRDKHNQIVCKLGINKPQNAEYIPLAANMLPEAVEALRQIGSLNRVTGETESPKYVQAGMYHEMRNTARDFLARLEAATEPEPTGDPL